MNKNLIYFSIITNLLVASVSFGQKKPAFTIVLNGQIISTAEADELAEKGKIASMNKGVPQQKRDSLYAIHGDIIGDPATVIELVLRTEEDMMEQLRISTKAIDSTMVTEDLFFVEINAKAPSFEIPTIYGDSSFKFDGTANKVVLINFWATWCGPCIVEFGEIATQILPNFSGNDFLFVPIAIGQKKETVLKKMKDLRKFEFDFNSGYDTEAIVWHKYASGSIPKSVLIDKNGMIRFLYQGYSSEQIEKLKDNIHQLLSE